MSATAASPESTEKIFAPDYRVHYADGLTISAGSHVLIIDAIDHHGQLITGIAIPSYHLKFLMDSIPRLAKESA